MNVLKRALLVGYYGYGNFGDEILLEASIEILSRHGYEITVLYPTPGKMGNVRLVYRFDPFKVLFEIARSDLVVFGGGGIFQDETSFKSLLYYSLIVRVSLFLGKRVLLVGNSIGPLRRKISRRMVRSILKHPRVIIFPRDPVTERYSSMFSKKVYRGTDLSIFFMRGLQKKGRRKTALLVPKKMIGWGKISNFLEAKGYEVIVSIASSEDEDTVSGMEDRLKRGNLIEFISSSSLVVSERFHPCLVAAYLGIPFVSVGERKTDRFFRKLLGNYPGFSRKVPEDVMVRIEKVEGMEIDIREKLEKDLNAMLEKLDKILRNV